MKAREEVVILTGVSLDHMDYFGDGNALSSMLRSFVRWKCRACRTRNRSLEEHCHGPLLRLVGWRAVRVTSAGVTVSRVPELLLMSSSSRLWEMIPDIYQLLEEHNENDCSVLLKRTHVRTNSHSQKTFLN